MTLYGPPRRPIFWKLDPRTIARDDTKVTKLHARGEQIGNIGFGLATIGATSFKVCAPDNDFADLARSSLRERAESYAKGRQGEGAESPLNNAKGEQTASLYIRIRLYTRA